MRYMSKKTEQVILSGKVGEQRIVKKFLFFPRQFGSEFARIFEYAYIIEEVRVVATASWDQECPYTYGWVEIGFANSIEVIEHISSTKRALDEKMNTEEVRHD